MFISWQFFYIIIFLKEILKVFELYLKIEYKFAKKSNIVYNNNEL